MTANPGRPSRALARLEETIAARAESFPEVTVHRPWGHLAFKVKGKTFLFLGTDAHAVSFSVKLPLSRTRALELPFTEPTHYGLGKSGWITARFTAEKQAPMTLIDPWLLESYRAIAPKKLAATLPAQPRDPKQSPILRAERTSKKASSRRKPSAPTTSTRAVKGGRPIAKSAPAAKRRSSKKATKKAT